MPSEPMSNAPFPTPPNSPFFPTSGSGEACFKFENGVWSLCTFNSWPSEAQARCAAMALAEFNHLSEVKPEDIGECARACGPCAAAFAAARERMNSKTGKDGKR